MPARLRRIFPRPKPVVAVIHTGPSPGVPGCTDVRCAADRAVAETRMLVDLGVDGLLVENAHDLPAVSESEMGPEVIAFLTRVALAVKRHADRLPVGVRVMGGANRAALAVAHGASCDFVRVEGWDVPGNDAGLFYRYRQSLGATQLPILADIRPGTVDETVKAVRTVEAMQPDALVVLGPRVGESPAEGVVDAACEAATLPLLCGGGLDADSLDAYIDRADGFLVGSGLKEDGRWQAPVCEPRVRALIGAVEYARGQEVRQ